MAYNRKWKPSRSKARQFAQQMDEVRAYCDANSVRYSSSMDSFYFTINGQDYRVSNHSVEASNSRAYGVDPFTGEWVQKREKYHEGGRLDDTVYIHASKTRIIEIHQALLAGKKLNGRGMVV